MPEITVIHETLPEVRRVSAEEGMPIFSSSTNNDNVTYAENTKHFRLLSAGAVIVVGIIIAGMAMANQSGNMQDKNAARAESSGFGLRVVDNSKEMSKENSEETTEDSYGEAAEENYENAAEENYENATEENYDSQTSSASSDGTSPVYSEKEVAQIILKDMSEGSSVGWEYEMTDYGTYYDHENSAKELDARYLLPVWKNRAKNERTLEHVDEIIVITTDNRVYTDISVGGYTNEDGNPTAEYDPDLTDALQESVGISD